MIYTAEIKEIDKNTNIIKWTGSDGFGNVTIKYDDKGGYYFDTEYISLSTLFQIIQKLEF